MEDFSDKGEKEFYKRWFEETGSMMKNYRADENFKEAMRYKIEYLRSYMYQKDMYKKQLGMFWGTKRDHLIKCMREKEKYNGAISLESQEMDKTLKNHEVRLSKMSSSFKDDLEKIINEDRELNHLTINLN